MDISKIESVIRDFYFVFAGAVKWAFCFKIAKDLLENGMNSDVKGILDCVLKGSAGYAAMCGSVYILDEIKDAFK